MPLDIELDGFFECRKGESTYAIPYVHHAKENTDWTTALYCESARYNVYIGPDGRLSPCMGFADTAIAGKFPNILEEDLETLTLKGYYHDVVYTRISDLLEKNPQCRECEYLPAAADAWCRASWTRETILYRTTAAAISIST